MSREINYCFNLSLKPLKMNIMNSLQRSSGLLFKYFVALLLVTFTSTAIYSQKIDNSILGALKYRSIGPTRQGGRFVDFAVAEGNSSTFYAALASGGVWKTVNNGISFEPVFDAEGVISVGDIAIDPSNENIIWVGTGESNNSRTAYYGDGIYRSDDGGKSWKNMGLKESHHIGRIIVHPNDGNIVWVAAAGHLYSENSERGVYKTTDGGKSWKKTLDIVVKGKNIGVNDIAIDNSDPKVLYAASYDKVRKPWTFNPGGPGSRIYKSIDGGESWSRLAGGLPEGMLGRIGLAVSPSNTSVVYANIENCNLDGVTEEERYNQLLNGITPKGGKESVAEMYRSDDKGTTWKKISPDGQDVGGGPAYYYQQICIDPVDPDHVYVLGVRMWETINGGKDWRQPFRFGGDNHAMWIDAANSKHMLLGYDHGLGITYDAGINWYHPDFMAVGQLVAVGFDNEFPYNVYGGLQDNGSAKGPSTKRDGGAIRLEDWKSVGGGDGMYNEVDPEDSRWLYNESQFGPLRRLDQITGESKSIRFGEMDRWAWNAPIVVSHHNSKTIYHAGNKVVRSRNQGETWEVISPDLSTNDTLKTNGTGNITHCNIVTLDESPVKDGLLWAGTDDGKVWVTRDGGEAWSDVTANIPGHPGYWVSRVEASYAAEGTAYVTITGLRNDDFRPFIWKTTDFGATWVSIAATLPADESICVVREHPAKGNLLFAGTTKAVYVSFDGGKIWNQLRNNMPNNPVEDMKIHPRENDLIVGTHGRSFWIADLTWLSELSNEVLMKDFHLFAPENKVKWVNKGSNNSSSSNFDGESEPVGVPITYYLKAGAKDVKISVFEGSRLVYETNGKGEKGINSVIWNFTVNQGRAVQQRSGQTQGRMMFSSGPTVKPGNFTVKVTANGKSETGTFTVLADEWY